VDGTNKVVLHPTITLPWRPPGGLPLPEIDPVIVSALEWAAGQLVPPPDIGQPAPPEKAGRAKGLGGVSQGDDEATETQRRQPEGRLVFDLATLTVTLDGKEHHIEEIKAFLVYKAIAEAKQPPITNTEIQEQVKGVKGRHAIRRRIDSLPPGLCRTVK